MRQVYMYLVESKYRVETGPDGRSMAMFSSDTAGPNWQEAAERLRPLLPLLD